MVTGFEMRHDNDVLGLGWIHQFGWMRSVELGRMMWPNDQHSRTRADRVIRGWIERGLVIERKLPDGARRAVVLSEAGARLLNGTAITGASSGKDWGETDGLRWKPNANWRHDLLATGVLTHLYEDGYEVIPEKTLRRENPALVKIPDGLAWNSQRVIWLEVENARKTGAAMKNLAEAICVVATGACKPVSGHKPTLPILAFVTDGKDERGLQLNHPMRVSKAIQIAAKEEVTLGWAECSLAGCGVTAVKLQIERIQANRALKILSILNAGGWQEDSNGCQVAQYGGFTATIWFDDLMGWSYQVEGVGTHEPAGQAENISEAKYGCANVLTKLQ